MVEDWWFGVCFFLFWGEGSNWGFWAGWWVFASPMDPTTATFSEGTESLLKTPQFLTS